MNPSASVESNPQGSILARRITRAALAIAAIAAGAKALGFVEKVVVADAFGTGLEADAFFVATSVPFLLFLLIREMLEPGYLPLFVGNLGRGAERRGWQLFTGVGAFLLLLTATFGALVWWRAESVVGFLTDFEGEALTRTAELVAVMAPGIVFLGLSALTYITLNGYQRFAVPALGDLVLKAGPLLGCVLLLPRLGVLALGVGFVAGAFLRLLVHGLGLGAKLRLLTWPRDEGRRDLRALAWLTLPLVVGASFSQVSELADNYFSSQVGEGGVAARTYAKKIRDLPLELVSYTLSIVLFPFFANLWSAGKRADAIALLSASVRGLALVFAALGVAIVLLADPIVSLALERGEFGAEARRATAWPLRLYGLGMVAFAVEAIVVNFYFALRNTRTPVVLGIVGQVLNIGLCALLLEPMGIGGVALALTISRSVKLVLLAYFLRSSLPEMRWGSILASAVRIGLAAAGSAAALGLFAHLRPLDLQVAAASAKAVHLGVGGILSVLAFGVVILLLGGPERRLVGDAASRLARLARRG